MWGVKIAIGFALESPPKRGGGRLQGCLITRGGAQLNGAGASRADALDKCSRALLHCWKMLALRRHVGAWRAVLHLGAVSPSSLVAGP